MNQMTRAAFTSSAPSSPTSTASELADAEAYITRLDGVRSLFAQLVDEREAARGDRAAPAFATAAPPAITSASAASRGRADERSNRGERPQEGRRGGTGARRRNLMSTLAEKALVESFRTTTDDSASVNREALRAEDDGPGARASARSSPPRSAHATSASEAEDVPARARAEERPSQQPEARDHAPGLHRARAEKKPRQPLDGTRASTTRREP